MKRLIIILLLCANGAFAQNSIKVLLRDSVAKTRITAVSVNINGNTKPLFTDSAGFATITNVPSGNQKLVFSTAGYQSRELR